MVLESPEVTKECVETCGLTAAELLRPFGVLPELNGSVGGQPAWGGDGGVPTGSRRQLGSAARAQAHRQAPARTC